jgi:hypothetical protein
VDYTPRLTNCQLIIENGYFRNLAYFGKILAHWDLPWRVPGFWVVMTTQNPGVNHGDSQRTSLDLLVQCIINVIRNAIFSAGKSRLSLIFNNNK